MVKKAGLFVSLTSVLLLMFVIVNSDAFTKMRIVFIDGDGSGHYAYLPAIVLNRSVDFTPVYEAEKSRKSADYVGHNYHNEHGITINKFTCGTALLQSPFFGLAYIISVLSGLPPDGYHVVFQYAVGLAGVFWLAVGLWFLIQLLRLWRIEKKVAIGFALAGTLATNLFFYGFVNPSFSHVYSFAAITIFYYYSSRFFKKQQTADFYGAAFLLGLIVVIRPVNVLSVLAIPFLAGGFSSFWKQLFHLITWKRAGRAALLFLLALSPQVLINYLQTGRLMLDGYQNEGFYFLQPHLADFLISYKKGWFVYTPFMLLVLPAMYMVYRRSVGQFAAFSFFLVVIVYVFSSWWNWFYGDSFGMRPMVDYYGLLVLLIAMGYQGLKGVRLKRLVFVFVGFTIFLNLFQSYQYSTGILHPDSMNRQSYWYVFLKSAPKYRGAVAGGDEYFYGKLQEPPFLTSLNTIDQLPVNWALNEKSVVYSPSANSLVIEQNKEFIYSPSFRFAIPDNYTKDSLVYVRLSMSYSEKEENAALHALLVMDITDKVGQHVFYKAFRMKRLPDEEKDVWRQTSLGVKLPPILPGYKEVKLYVWNKDQGNYLLDNIGFEFYRY
ncbi:MAG: hypothetical protein CVT99_00135 [Bacteroidetes bacterium HGW-Bacteroidetes-16]|jgi:hypothetical protein|nr:MAG: hypothetical protein CVT99_00135 [Bacteroidetes bacterium HGW-Bacteroidetes-16]